MKKLTARQVEVMDALIRLGDRKLVARELQIERNTVDSILRNAVARMGVRNRLQAVLKYDRERRPVIISTHGVATGQSTRWCPECIAFCDQEWRRAMEQEDDDDLYY